MNVPTYINTLYVKYETEAGLSAAKSLDITNNIVTYTVPADSKEMETPLAYSAKTNLSRANGQAVIFYPAQENGWGTLMFEDLWPAYGDYDFNDFVVNYKMQLYPNNKNMVKEMILGIRVKAIGGSLPYDLCLAIKGIKAGEIEECEKQNPTMPWKADMKLLNPGGSVKNTPIFRFDNIRANASSKVSLSLTQIR
ncbi:MAG: LruC domain-containing protein [Butyricimonas paravirosa]